jgi:hypothetical protein
MRRFVLGWKKLGHEKRLKAYIINYADDLVICCRAGADEALNLMRNMMSRLKLTDAATLVASLNWKITGWANYFCLRSAKPIEPWRNIRAGGFASGCVSNTKSGQVGARVFPC